MRDDGDGDGQLRVHFLPLSLDGRLGFTLMPGRRGRDEHGRFWTRDLEEDLDRLVRVVGTDVLLLVATEEELSSGRVPHLADAARSRGVEVVERPMASGAPLSLDALRPLVARVEAEVTSGQTVIVASGDGLGRAPMVGACFLVAQGASADRALGIVRKLRGPECLPPGPLADLVESFSGRGPAPRNAPPAAAAELPEPPPDPSEGPIRTVGAARAAALYGTAPPAPAPPSAAPAPVPPPTLDIAALEAPKAPAPPRLTPVAFSPVESAFVGAVLGAALGDALGAPVDGLSDRGQLIARFGPDGPQAPRVSPSPEGGAPLALLSDDGQHLELALESMVEARQRRWELAEATERLAERVARWASDPRGGPREPEASSLEAGRRLAAGTPWPEAGSTGASGTTGLARALALGLAFARDLLRAEQWGLAQSRITHRAPESLAASAAVAVGVARLTRGESWALTLSEMVAAACRHSPKLASRMARALHDADAGVPPGLALERFSERSAPDAVASALYVVRRHPDDAETAIREAVTTPGPSSSVGALVGGLHGARLGVGGLPPGWLPVLERREALEALALALAAGG